MPLLHDLLAALAAGRDPGPFALIRREGADHLDVLTGTVETVTHIADIDLPPAPAGPQVLALVPYRQLAERGFTCVDDGTPLECLRIGGSEQVALPAALHALSGLPERDVVCAGGGFDIDDDEYARTVAAVLRDEIGQGEGSNFVIHRTYTASIAGPPLAAALAVLHRLLVGERGTYWTFVVHTGTRVLVGATPERHVSVSDGLVMMNPISGTHRLPATGPDRDALLSFLADRKEIDELHMVLDEELKMMARVAEAGGQVLGPYLKEMANLVHTEYLLVGRGHLDVRDVLRETMFAPTVTGSPLENAARVIARHERRGRRYYAGVLALFGRDDAGCQTLDAPILIRTAEISPTGELRVPVGATLVRHSTPAGETAETHTKAAGILAALGVRPQPQPRRSGLPGSAVPPSPAVLSPAAPSFEAPSFEAPSLADDPLIVTALAARTERLARFWLRDRGTGARTRSALDGRSALIADGEDAFSGMLAHQLRGLGLAVTVRGWDEVGDTKGFDLLVAGPGPGDPTVRDDRRMTTLRSLVTAALDRRQPLLAVCLGHQILADLLGLRLRRWEQTCQGLTREIDVFGQRRRVGFYSTFTAVAAHSQLATPYGTVELDRDTDEHPDGPGAAVHALRGPGFAGLQFHPESVLSEDGFDLLREVLGELLPATAAHATAPAPALP
ncbi:phenazine biosynthesis protein phzE [Parafrankia irregularis]|uniref:anthranilate synthase n=1 Tax=Parafrankia irregularis TaxID=795642 RepID=A0A0S4QGQ4_9ACTN|nr:MULTISPECIES: anthranilate synthase family protein [Parafrankia]MBE3200987.1 chorismate-binding protein [Parafrankia sp. CH37]CUU54615.1 phenazine biosynthesis protein phzE [Parafrankia irregularis]